ncbi:radical SAM protein [archaeon]|nr:MAG: radical SAM protein [archaeon]
MGRMIFRVDDSGIPLMGCIAFGFIDRGTNVIQVRPTSLCPLSCIFCSTDAGPMSRTRITEYIVDLDYMIEWFREIVRLKGINDIEAHIDTVGDPFTYDRLPELVQELASFDEVKVVSIQTHGHLLNEWILDELDEAGLSRINLSIDALDPELARVMAGTPSYDVGKVMRMAEYIVENTSIDLLIAPLWLPGYNDHEIPRIIEYAIKIGAGKKWPPLGIQKYIPHKRGRKPKGVKPMTWQQFHAKLAEWEKKYNVKLILSPEDFGTYKTGMIECPFKVGEAVTVKIVGPGWRKGEWLATARNRSITVTGVPFPEPPIDSYVKVKIIGTKHNIVMAEFRP